MTTALNSAQLRWFGQQSRKRRMKAAERVAVLSLVHAYESTGLTRTAAIAIAGRAAGVTDRTVWAWLGLVNGGASPSDMAFRLFQLCPRGTANGA